MTNKKSKNGEDNATTKSVTITCKAPEASTVCVAGEFNAWDPCVAPMKKGRDGSWKLRLQLPVGQFQYKFIVDGEWCCEPGCAGDHECPKCVLNDMGTMNRTLEVV
jgi:5'-AMP-activated protein kinase regulatory beta subunit